MVKATRTVNRLHFDDLDPHRFEDLVRQILHNYQAWHTLEATGRGGSDDGIDIRGILLTPPPDPQIGPFIQHVWIIQCKRYQRLTPGQVREIVRDNLERQAEIPFGYILVAACDFSKEAYDVFRETVSHYGIQQALIWGKDELEDQLKLEKNRYLLHDFFGLTIDDLAGEALRIPPAAGEPPFKGLRYFNVLDAPLFYGREELTAILINRLRVENCLAIVGASGSGKSSLVRAGIVATLQGGKPLADGTELPEGSWDWPVYILEPGTHPLENLAVCLTREAESVTATTRLMDDMLADPRSLHLYLRKLLAANPRHPEHLLLVVDQFEEVYTACKDESERKAFIENLMTVVAPVHAGPTILVLTLRVDFYKHCAGYGDLRALLEKHQAFISPMTLEELRRAIEQPAVQNRWDFEPGLVDLMLREIEDQPGALPLLSHALLETWERRQGRTLTLHGYKEAGEIRQAIAKTADRVYQRLSPEQQAIARGIFLRLTEFGGEGVTQDTRRRATLDELVPDSDGRSEVENVLQTLADARLVTIEEDTVEISHEALIREWPVFGEWLEENRDVNRVHRHLTKAALEWERVGKDQGDLYRGSRLGLAWEWWQSGNLALNELERSFLQASQAEETRAAARMKIRNRVIMGVGIVAFLAAIFAIIFGLQAEAQKEIAQNYSTQSAQNAATAEERRLAAEDAQAEAEEKTFEASAGELAGLALVQLEEHHDLAMLLSIEAYTSTSTLLTRQALYSAWKYNHRLMHIFPRQGDWVGSIAFHPDEKILALVLTTEIRLLNVDPGSPDFGRPLGDFSIEDTSRINDMVFSPDGALLVAGTSDGTIFMWDVEDVNSSSFGEPVGNHLTEHKGSVNSVAFSSDGNFLASGSSDKTILLWNVDGDSPDFGEPIGSPLTPLDGPINSVAFSPDGKFLASGSSDTIRLWEADVGSQSFKPIRTRLTGNEGEVLSMAFSTDGKLLASGSANGAIRLWDVEVGSPTYGQSFAGPLTGHTDEVIRVNFDLNGNVLVSASRDGTIQRWWVDIEYKDFRPIGKPILGHHFWVNSFAFSPNEQILASSGGSEGTILLWDVGEIPWKYQEDYEFEVGLTDLESPLDDFLETLSPDWRTLAFKSTEDTIVLWDMVFDSPNFGQPILELLPKGAGEINSLTYSPDGKILGAILSGQQIQLWDVNVGARTFGQPFDEPLTWPTSAIYCIAFNPDRSLLAAGTGDGILLWKRAIDSNTFGMPIALESLGRLTGEVKSLTFSHDGNILASGSVDGTIHLWDMVVDSPTFGQPLGEPLTGHHGMVTSVAFDPKGEILISSGMGDGAIRLWDVGVNPQTFGQVLENPIAENPTDILDATLSPNGRTYAALLKNHTVRLWDVGNNSPTFGQTTLSEPFTGSYGYLTSIAFSPDGIHLASGSSLGWLQMWTVDPATWVQESCQRVGRNLTETEWNQYLSWKGFYDPNYKTCPQWDQ